MLRQNLEEEAKIMKDVPGWKVRVPPGVAALQSGQWKWINTCNLDCSIRDSVLFYTQTVFTQHVVSMHA